MRARTWATWVIGSVLCTAAALAGREATTTAAPLAAEAFVGDPGFTYQGQIRRNGSLVNGACTMAFTLWDQDVNGSAVSETLTRTVTVAGGLFAVELPFNNAGFVIRPFNGPILWLDVRADCGGGVAALGRQKLTPAPYAMTLVPGAVISASSGAALKISGHGDNYVATWIEAHGGNSAGMYVSSAGGTGVIAKTFSAGSSGLSATNDAQGGNGAGVNGYSYSPNGFGVYGSSNGTGVIGHGHVPSATGVWATNNSFTGTALYVEKGAIRVQGAGIGGSGPVFVHPAIGGSICVGRPYATAIDHPLTNGNPHAVLIITPNYGTVGGSPPYGSRPVAGPAKDIPAVMYDDVDWCGHGAGKWIIYTLNTASLEVNSLYNVLVVRP